MHPSDLYARVFENARNGLLLLEETSGRVVDANPSFLHMAERVRADVVDRCFWEPPLIADPAAAAEVREHLHAGGAVEGARLPLCSGSGRWLLLEVGGGPAAAGILHLEIRDVTGQEQERLAAHMDALRAMSGRVAWEFGDLHRVLQSMGELLLSNAGRGQPVFRELDEIRRAGERASAISGQLLAFSGGLALETRPVELNELLESMAPQLQRLFGRDIEISLDLDAELEPVLADPAQIRQIVLKLAANAHDAMPHGGFFKLETRRAQAVEAGLGHAQEAGGPFGMLAVRDSGTGLDNESWSHLYEPFFSTKGEGRGLGLAAVHGTVRQLGGRLWVHSEPGKGATFRIYLPLAKGAFPALPVVRDGRLFLGGRTILLVEANDGLRSVIANILRRRGYHLLAATHPREALELVAARGAPDLLICGPEADLASRITRMQPQLRVLYLGGYTDEAATRTEKPPPGAAMLRKPFEMETLFSRVRELLES